jgi:hypothetical protein
LRWSSLSFPGLVGQRLVAAAMPRMLEGAARAHSEILKLASFSMSDPEASSTALAM